MNDYRLPIPYNLQFFAKEGPGGEKTEAATDKKLEDARKEGQVARSREIGNALVLLAMFIVLKIIIGWIGNRFLLDFNTIYDFYPEAIVQWNGYLPEQDMRLYFNKLLTEVLLITAPMLLVAFVLSFVSDVAQVKWKPTLKPLKPKFSKMSPKSGIKRIFSVNSIMELVKALLKIVLIVLVCYTYLRGKSNLLFVLYEMPLVQAIQLIGDTVITLGLRIAIVYILIALIDFIYQKVKFANDMKMTKQEVKDEYKNMEGDPQIKGKIRQKMQEASRRRMMQQLPQADVVITNPTHYACALKYDPDAYDAPVMVAKGADYLAQRIKQVARDHDIEIVEDKPLARMLYANVEVGEMIPPELYQAVAEVLAFVFHARGRD